MKHLILILVGVIVSVDIYAQRKVIESFDSNKFNWEEFYEKDCIAGVQDGYYVFLNNYSNFLIQEKKFKIWNKSEEKLV